MDALQAWFVLHYELFHDFAAPIATLVAATVAAGITFYFNRSQKRIAEEQAKTAKQQAELATVRLQHDLYDRRFAIFEAARNLIVRQIYIHNKVSDEAYTSFFRGIADAVFLLDDTLTDYLEDIRIKALKLKLLNEKITSIEAGDERIKAVADETEILNWFYDQEEPLIDKFKPFLSLKGEMSK